MKPMKSSVTTYALGAALAGAVAFASNAVLADPPGASCPVTHAELTDALAAAAPDAANNGGFNFHMWATVVNVNGVVCNVTRTADLGEQWPASRVISAQKAHTAWSLSHQTFALSTANLWAPTQPGGSLWELTQSNPVNAAAAYAGNHIKNGKPCD